MSEREQQIAQELLSMADRFENRRLGLMSIRRLALRLLVSGKVWRRESEEAGR